MATAKANSRMERVVTSVELNLEPEEAQFLADLMARIAGSPRNTRRVHADSIGQALRSAGMDWSDSQFVEKWQLTDMDGRIQMLPIDD